MKPHAPHSLDSLKTVHIVGVCGTLMGAFAAFLKRYGVQVSGSDQNVYPPMSTVLENAGVRLMNGYSAENLTMDGVRPDLVVIGNVIRSDNPEARAAIDGGYAYTSLPQAMEQLMLSRTRNLVVAGTHGKTTTSSMLAHVLVACGKDPNYFIGGVPHDLPHSFHVSSVSEGRTFVLEGDEYDTAFWDKVPKFNHYLPDDVIFTSMEFDHADIYADFSAVQRAFDGLMERVRPGGRLIACYEYPEIIPMAEALSKTGRAEVVSYALAESVGAAQARFTVGNIESSVIGDETFTAAEIYEYGKKVDRISLRLSGHHNALNALSVWIEAHSLGLNPDSVRSALSSFRGVKRRQEVCGEVRGVLVMDDFAHHPTAVRETLRGLKQRYPKRRIVAIFEPRSATSRRKFFQTDYARAFQEGDATFIAAPYDQTRIADADQFSSQQLVSDVARMGRPAFLMADVESGVTQVAQFAQEGDLVAVLSNGGFGGFTSKLLNALKS